MATISAANVTAITDSVARHITDLAALVGSNTAIVAGQATTLGKIAALNDASQLYALIDGFQGAVNAESALLANLASYNAILDSMAPAVIAMEKATGGLQAFLVANTIQVAPAYADAHNRAAVTRGSVIALTAVGVFGKAIANMGSITLSGAGAGAFTDNAAQAAGYGNAPLSIFNNKGSAGGAATATYTVTYSAWVAGVLTTGLTASAVMPASSANLAAVSLAVSGVDITAITVAGGTAADVVGVSASLVRTPAY